MRLFRFSRFALALGVLCASVQGASALRYRFADAQFPGCKGTCPKVIVATGTFDVEEHLQLLVFLDQNAQSAQPSNILVIDSPGGFSSGGMYLGLLARHLKMTVIVGRWTGETITPTQGLAPGQCASACVFSLAGGVRRLFVPGSRIGVHQQSTGRQVLDPTTRRPVNATVDYEEGFQSYRRYFASLGVDAANIVAKLSQTRAEDMYWFSEAELAKFRLAQSAASAAGSRKRR